MFSPGDVVAIDFPRVTGVKRRPAVVLSSPAYHAARLDLIVGLVTSRTATLGPTDCALQDWTAAGMKVASAFRSFLVTLPSAARLVLIGHLSDAGWKLVQACVKTALAPFEDPAAPPP